MTAVGRELADHSASCVDYDVSTGPVSIHLPPVALCGGPAPLPGPVWPRLRLSRVPVPGQADARAAHGAPAADTAEVSGLYVVGGGAYTLQVAASSTVRATRSCRATGTSSSRCVQPRRGCGGGAYPSTSRLVDRADNASQLKT
ncbi:hypothetical protein MRX96_017969 [Rhipicephalus microplus]